MHGLPGGVRVEWSDIRIFLAIVRGGSLGAAARSTGSTQPTMGRRLRALELAVGSTLFQRTSAGLVLTDDGAAVLDHAERIEAEVLGIERRLMGQTQQLQGRLRITSSDWFGQHMLAPVIAEFLLANPGVDIELLTDARFLSLSQREADLAVRIRPFDEPDVVSRRLLHMPHRAYIAADAIHPRAGDGTGHRLICMNAAFSGLPDDSWLQKTLPNAVVAFRSNDRDAQAAMCALGVGIAVLPVPLGQRTPGIEPLHFDTVPPGRDTWLGYHRDLRRLARLRALVDLIVLRLSDGATA